MEVGILGSVAIRWLNQMGTWTEPTYLATSEDGENWTVIRSGDRLRLMRFVGVPTDQDQAAYLYAQQQRGISMEACLMEDCLMERSVCG